MTAAAPNTLTTLKRRVGVALYRGRHRARKDVPRRIYLARVAWRRPSYASSLEHVVARDEIPALLNRRGLLGDAVEVGVKRARYSELLLGTWRGRRLISVDPWLEADPKEYVDRANVPQNRHERYYEEARGRLARFGARSEIWRLTSLEAAARLDDGSLDFVYIDARHDYESVTEDVAVWCPKVRGGGILAGHDYVDGSFPQGEFGVKSAVDEFAAAHRLRVHATSAPPYVELFPSWLIEIP